jgi:hypothetical protein
MASIHPICPNSSAHKLGACLQELGSLYPSDHRSTYDMLNYGSDASLRKYVAAPISEQQIGALC